MNMREQIEKYIKENQLNVSDESMWGFDESIEDELLYFCLLYTSILALIGTLNFINLTYTSINERSGELKTLHAVGMTNKQIKNMLAAEGVMRILFTFVVVLTVGIGLNHTRCV